MKRKELQGQRFGAWLVLALGPRSNLGKTRWLCRCDCGTEQLVDYGSLVYRESPKCHECSRQRNIQIATAKRDFQGEKNPSCIRARKKYGEHYISSKSPWFRRAASVMQRAKGEGAVVGFSSVQEFACYLASICPNECPVFRVPLQEAHGKGCGPQTFSYSVDRIDPVLGYVRGNIQIISFLANKMKCYATPEQLKQFAQWVLRND